MLWRDYLRMLAEDGVELAVSEEEAITEDGRRIAAYTLTRWINGKLLWYPLPGPVKNDERVPWIVRRQAPNVLRLPPEKYIFPKR